MFVFREKVEVEKSDDQSLLGRLKKQKKQTFISIALFAVAYIAWISTMAVGHTVLFEYELASGPFANTSRIWPAKAKIPFIKEKQNVVMFIHPMCPCSAASVTEFNYLVREGGDDTIGQVVVMMPLNYESEWSRQPILSTIRRLRHVTTINDIDGSEAANFGAETSGHVFVYDERGVLQFSGGITGMRGHEGNNANFQAAKAALNSRHPSFHQAPVFGCSLR